MPCQSISRFVNLALKALCMWPGTGETQNKHEESIPKTGKSLQMSTYVNKVFFSLVKGNHPVL